MQRVYSNKTYRLMKRIRLGILTITSPIWIPFYLLIYIGLWSEALIDYADDTLQKLLDKYTPR